MSADIRDVKKMNSHQEKHGFKLWNKLKIKKKSASSIDGTMKTVRTSTPSAGSGGVTLPNSDIDPISQSLLKDVFKMKVLKPTKNTYHNKD